LIINGKNIEGEFDNLRQALEKNSMYSDNVVGIKIGKATYVDLMSPLPNTDKEAKIITLNDKDALIFLRHTLSHVMAQAVQRLYGNVKLGIGPVIENGFYYDIDVKLSNEDLAKIEEEMKNIVAENLELTRYELLKEDAIKFYEEKEQTFKVDLVKRIPDDKVSFYKQGEFVDLCRGPHIPRTGLAKHFKLLTVAGAYWHGDERNPMLTRIYGTAFLNKKELKTYLFQIEEAKKRDHRKLGPALDLFSFDHEKAPGMAFFHPKGLLVMDKLTEYWRKIHEEHNYKLIRTPMIMSDSLWKQSGHWDHYKDNMYFSTMENKGYAVKPMNCPGHIIVYKSRPRTYKDLPIKFAEMGIVHRYEKSGVLHGLFRVRGFTQDDAHIFCKEDQIENEIKDIVDIIKEVYGKFGFEYKVELSTRPEDSMGSDELWETATSSLERSLKDMGMEYEINEGDGAFYGPKIDFHIKDSIGRSWQCATIQLDFQMPLRFELEYIDSDNTPKRPVMIHRVVFGSLERFFGILVENYAGAFPVWLSPVQVKVIPVSDKSNDYGNKILKELSSKGIRAEIDKSSNTMGYKVRNAQLEKIPFMLVVGEKEEKDNVVNVRLRNKKVLGTMSIQEFLKYFNENIDSTLK
jgi:threonyl-tRNA synthetase